MLSQATPKQPETLVRKIGKLSESRSFVIFERTRSFDRFQNQAPT